MQVSNLIQNIGKCRDLISKGDTKKLIANCYLFLKVYNDVNIQVNKYCKDSKHELDFTYHDLKELSDEIANYLASMDFKPSADGFIEDIKKNKVINNKVVSEFNQKMCDLLMLDRVLRECQKVLAYSAYVVWLWNENNAQKEEDSESYYTIELTKTIRSFYNA